MEHKYKASDEYPFKIMETIEDKSDILQYKKGQFVYSEGSTPLGVYFVQKGKVKITKIGSDGKEQIIRIASSQELLSYTDLVSNSKYSNSAKALENTTILFMTKHEFWNTIREERQLFERFVLLLSFDLKNAEIKIIDLAYKPVRGRVADALILLSRKFNSNQVQITRYDLACYVGTARETINRILSEFRKDHLIETDGIKINILNLKGLIGVGKMYD